MGNNPAYAANFSPDGRTLAAWNYEGGVRLWDVGTGKEIGRLRAMLDEAQRQPPASDAENDAAPETP